MSQSVVVEGGGRGPQHAGQGPAGPWSHPVPGQGGYPGQGSPAPQGGGGNGTAPPSGYPDTLLPSGAQVVGYVDRAASKIPWWAWLAAGAVAYHFIIHRPVWKASRRQS